MDGGNFFLPLGLEFRVSGLVFCGLGLGLVQDLFISGVSTYSKPESEKKEQSGYILWLRRVTR